MASLNDLGVFDQAVWGTLHGQWFLNTSSAFNAPINWLGFHFNPFLLLFVPLYALWPSPEWFALAQALALSIAAWPLYKLAAHLSQSTKAAFFWAAAYLCNPFVLSAGAWDFHPVTLAVPFITLAMYAIGTGRARLLVGACLTLLLVQEQMGTTVAGLGLAWAWYTRGWRLGVALAVLGVAHLLLVMQVLMPMLSPTGQHLMLSSDLGQLSRYGWLGNSLGEVVQTLLTKPVAVLTIVFRDFGGLQYLQFVLVPSLGLSLVAPAMWLPGLGDLAANILSNNSMPRSIGAYHGCTLAAVGTAAAIFGAQRLSRAWRPLSAPLLAGLVLASSAFLGYLSLPLPLPGAVNYWQPVAWATAPDPVAARVRAAVGDDASLSVQANVGPAFSSRREVYVFPVHADRVDAIVLHLHSPTHRLVPNDRLHIGGLTHHLQLPTAQYLDTVDALLASGRYGIRFEDGPWLVLSAQVPPDTARISAWRARVQALRVTWKADAPTVAAQRP